MSDVQIIETSIKQYEHLGHVTAAEVHCGKHKAVVCIYRRDGSAYRVNVQIMNASHRAFRGVGKWFDSIEDAVEGYKTMDIKAMIRAVAEIKED